MPRTEVCKNPSLVQSRLSNLGLRREALIEVAQKAAAARNDAVAIDPVNAAGLMAYIFGTRALRQYLLPNGWTIDRTENIEATVHPSSGITIVYQNCDSCCTPDSPPRPISAKGAASERMIEDRNGDFFVEELRAAEMAASGNLWFFCVSVNANDVRAELSCPVGLDGKQFGRFRERIFILQDGDIPRSLTAVTDVFEGGGRDEYDVVISRK